LDLIAGSCTIPVCATINNFPDLICPNFPAEVPCECPIPAGVFTANLNVPFFATWLNIEGGVTIRSPLARRQLAGITEAVAVHDAPPIDDVVRSRSLFLSPRHASPRLRTMDE